MAAEISRYARQKDISFADAHNEIHKAIWQIEQEPIFTRGPEAGG